MLPSKTPASDLARHDGPLQDLVVGDCLEVMATLPAGSVSCVVTSPPYNLNIGYASYDDRRGWDDYKGWLSEVGRAIARVLAPDGSVFLNVGSSLKAPLVPYMALEAFLESFVLQNNILWIKSLYVGAAAKTFGHFKPINSPRFLNHNFEHVFHLTHDGNVSVRRLEIGVPFEYSSNIARFGHEQDLRCRGNVWHIPYKSIQSRGRDRGGHPATFPVELPEMCLRLAGGTGLVLDPFSGTGTTLVAARNLGRPGLGIDLDPGYTEYARARLAEV